MKISFSTLMLILFEDGKTAKMTMNNGYVFIVSDINSHSYVFYSLQKQEVLKKNETLICSDDILEILQNVQNII